jgi:hypothetical protein
VRYRLSGLKASSDVWLLVVCKARAIVTWSVYCKEVTYSSQSTMRPAEHGLAITRLLEDDRPYFPLQQIVYLNWSFELSGAVRCGLQS